MRSLFLHIGQRGAGGEDLRACFARSRLGLLRAGLRFPRDWHERAGDPATADRSPTRRLHAVTGRWALARMLRGEDDVLLSDDGLGDMLAQDGFAAALSAAARAAGIGRIHVLMMVRDPLAHLTATYLDDIQNRRSAARFAEAARDFDQPQRALSLLQGLEELVLDVTLIDFAKAQGDIAATAARWLGVAPDALLPPRGVRTRPLTGLEAAFQRALNERLGADAPSLAEDLSEASAARDHDDRRAAPPRLSPADEDAFWARMRPAIIAVNERFADEGPYPPHPALRPAADPSAAEAPRDDDAPRQFAAAREDVRAVARALVRHIKA